ncbi:polysaccharide deacetylase family protein, partial [Bradyrhizobium sp.]|uniref:polysaccharide deacetylase family protein n=1 Tax=Bradyrhizobium sp. TaxID=376 RepID=UPI003C51D443
MVGNGLAGARVWSLTVLCLGLFATSAAQAASNEACPGHPDAIGTSRTIVVDPREHPRIGTMQYPETLPLRDHEVVLTFDDGPLPRNSNQVLKILADQCVKATFFIIGQQAQANPEGVRKYVAAGHSIGSHSQHHPLTFNKMSAEQAKVEIDAGIASITAALGDPNQLAPFFRVPGLLRAQPVEDYLGSRGIQIWSADFLADDWRHIPPQRVYELAIKRLDAIGKGILLLHDIQARTVAALPNILREMKARGYHIVHVVPATPELPATPTEPEQWQLHPPSEDVAISHWPKIPNFVFAEAGASPAPALADFDWPDATSSAEPFERTRRHGVPLPQEPPWPRLTAVPHENAAASLPVPAESLFTIPEQSRATLQPFPLRPHPRDQAVSTAAVGDAGGHGSVAATEPMSRARSGPRGRETRHYHYAHSRSPAGRSAAQH